MSRFYQIQIDPFFLSRTGTNAAPYAQAQIPGVEDLLTTVIGSQELSAGGNPIFQTFEWSKGKSFEVQVQTWITKDLWESLKDLINGALEDGTTFTVAGVGDIGNFSVTVRPQPKKPFQAESFTNERINKPVFRFVTV